MKNILAKTAHVTFVLSVLGLLIVLATSTAIAQPRDRMQMDPAERVERTIAAIDEHVGIADEQAEQLRPIFLEESERRRELMEQFGRANREAMRIPMEALREETNELVGEVLSEEQMTKYLEWQESRPRERRGGERPRRRGIGG